MKFSQLHFIPTRKDTFLPKCPTRSLSLPRARRKPEHFLKASRVQYTGDRTTVAAAGRTGPISRFKQQGGISRARHVGYSLLPLISDMPLQGQRWGRQRLPGGRTREGCHSKRATERHRSYGLAASTAGRGHPGALTSPLPPAGHGRPLTSRGIPVYSPGQIPPQGRGDLPDYTRPFHRVSFQSRPCFLATSLEGEDARGGFSDPRSLTCPGMSTRSAHPPPLFLPANSGN